MSNDFSEQLPPRKPFLIPDETAELYSRRLSSLPRKYIRGEVSKKESQAIIDLAREAVSLHGPEILSRMFFLEKNDAYWSRGKFYQQPTVKYTPDLPAPIDKFDLNSRCMNIAEMLRANGAGPALRSLLSMGMDPRDMALTSPYDAPADGSFLLEWISKMGQRSFSNAKAIWDAAYAIPELRTNITAVALAKLREYCESIWFHSSSVSGDKERMAVSCADNFFKILHKQKLLPDDLQKLYPVFLAKNLAIQQGASEGAEIGNTPPSYSTAEIQRQKILVSIMDLGADRPSFEAIFKISGLNTPEKINAQITAEIQTHISASSYTLVKHWPEVALIRNSFGCLSFLIDEGANPWILGSNPILSLMNRMINEFPADFKTILSSLLDGMERDGPIRYPDGHKPEIDRCFREILSEKKDHPTVHAFKSFLESRLFADRDAPSPTHRKSHRRL